MEEEEGRGRRKKERGRREEEGGGGREGGSTSEVEQAVEEFLLALLHGEEGTDIDSLTCLPQRLLDNNHMRI